MTTNEYNQIDFVRITFKDGKTTDFVYADNEIDELVFDCGGVHVVLVDTDNKNGDEFSITEFYPHSTIKDVLYHKIKT